VNRRLLLLGCSLCAVALLEVQPAQHRVAHATALAPFVLSSDVSTGIVIVSPQTGIITYCPAYANITGQSAGLQATPLGACVTMTGARPVPTSDNWKLTNVPNTHTFFLLDTTTGAIINCAVTIQVVVSGTPTVFAAGSCQNWGTAPQ
jgi:hypothetical protein